MQKTWFLAALLALCAPLVYAHGSDKHAPTAAYQAEQKDWGIMGDKRSATRTIIIDMTDAMRFTPGKLTLKEGETVRFVINNKGRLLHELVIGTAEELREHAALMARFPNMEHDAPYLAHVPPGKTGEIVWKFNRPGNFEFACLIPGHYEAGMRGSIAVTPRQH